jgi:hypothetical protein
MAGLIGLGSFLTLMIAKIESEERILSMKLSSTLDGTMRLHSSADTVERHNTVLAGCRHFSFLGNHLGDT